MVNFTDVNIQKSRYIDIWGTRFNLKFVFYFGWLWSIIYLLQKNPWHYLTATCQILCFRALLSVYLMPATICEVIRENYCSLEMRKWGIGDEFRGNWCVYSELFYYQWRLLSQISGVDLFDQRSSGGRIADFLSTLPRLKRLWNLLSPLLLLPVCLLYLYCWLFHC